MNFLRTTAQSLKLKLIVVIMVVATTVSISQIVVFSLHQAASRKQQLVYATDTLVEIIGLNSAASLQFSDANDATEILSSLSAQETVQQAYLFTAEGSLLAQYLRDGEQLSIPLVDLEQPSQQFSENAYTVVHPVMRSGVRLGTLYLLLDLSQLERDRFELLLVAGIVGLVCFMMALVLAMRLQRVFTKPIQQITTAMQQISDLEDYTVRVPRPAEEEYANLVERFHHMLSEVQRRDERLAQQMSELAQMNEELDQRVAERTVELQTANRELESFSYSVSHDLRAPLRSIAGFSQILLEESESSLDEEGRRLLQIICEDVQKMGCLIDDLLAFSRMSRQRLASCPIEMKEVFEQVFQELATLNADRTIRCDIGELPPAHADFSMVRQVIYNLLSNAIKFTAPKDSACIEVRGSTDNGLSVYTVKDNGVGFDMRYHDKLFGVFQRLHSDEEFEGTGVGLAIVHRVIQRHGGTVTAESTLGEGTMFSFSLPTTEATGEVS